MEIGAGLSVGGLGPKVKGDALTGLSCVTMERQIGQEGVRLAAGTPATGHSPSVREVLPIT